MKKGKRILKTVTALLCVVLCLAGLCGCNASSTSLPSGMDPDKALAQAQEIAMNLSKGEFEAVADQFSDDLKAQLTLEYLRESLSEKVEKDGTITKYLSWSMRGASDDEAGEYAVIVLVCKCEKGSATVTVCLDTEMKICGLSMK